VSIRWTSQPKFCPKKPVTTASGRTNVAIRAKRSPVALSRVETVD
jgi:hypothetical protein